LHDSLELRQALEGHRSGELDALRTQVLQQSAIEERAVQAGLDHGVRLSGADRLHARAHKRGGAPRVVNVAGPVHGIEELSRLSDSAVQRVVAARALALGVEADGRALRVPACGEHRSIEIERDAGQRLALEALEHGIASEGGHGRNASFVRIAKGTQDSWRRPGSDAIRAPVARAGPVRAAGVKAALERLPLDFTFGEIQSALQNRRILRSFPVHPVGSVLQIRNEGV
jgi:hypothetical protein